MKQILITLILTGCFAFSVNAQSKENNNQKKDKPENEKEQINKASLKEEKKDIEKSVIIGDINDKEFLLKRQQEKERNSSPQPKGAKKTGQKPE